MKIYTMLQIPAMSPALLLSAAGPVRSASSPAHVPATHVSSWRLRPVASVMQLPQVDQLRTQAELVRDELLAAAYGASDVQGTGVSLVSDSNESLKGRNGSAGSNGITGNKGTGVEMKRAFDGARGVPPRGRPV